MSKPDYYYRQSGVVPFRLKKGRYEILLITSRKQQHWTIPKGIIEPDLTARASAVKEAWEEAGVGGELVPDWSSSYQHQKWGGTCRIEVFLLRVENKLKHWLEDDVRQRRWFPLHEAASAVHNEALRQLLHQAAGWFAGEPAGGEKKMKTLILARHAKSDWGHPELRDFDRPLNRRGVKNAPYMGGRLEQRGVSPARIVSSPARRARETARLLAESLAVPEEDLIFDEQLYLASTEELLQIVRGLDDDWSSVLLVGHNPDMTELVNLLGDLRLDNLPTCGVAGYELDVASWEQVVPGCGSCQFYDYPKNPEPV